MLKLSEKDFKANTVKMLYKSITNSLETNRKVGKPQISFLLEKEVIGSGRDVSAEFSILLQDLSLVPVQT